MTSESGGRVVAGSGVRPFELADHNCFACGSLNRHGLRLVLHVEHGRCWTEVALADRFEGWSGIAHGGILATLLDEVMAWSLIGEESWGLTARLSIEFHRPVPIGRRLRAEGQVERSRRRLVQTSARILDATSGEVYATGTATYVAADPARRRDLQARYGFRFLEDRASSESSDAEVGASPSGAEVRA